MSARPAGSATRPRGRAVRAAAVRAGAVLAVVAVIAGDAVGVPGRSPQPAYSPPVAPVRVDPDSVPLGWGPSQGDLARALRLAHAMTDDEIAGQVIVARFLGQDPASVEALVSTYHLGGVILQGGNVGSAQGTAAIAAAAQRGAGERGWPAIVATDQEGGTVARLHRILPELPGFMAAGAARDKRAVWDAFAGQGAHMRELGITVDFAPVADVTIGLADPIIRSRAAGDDAGNVSATVLAAQFGLIEAGVVPGVKHFPGHGGVTIDSHVGLPRQAADVATLEARDLIPFRAAVRGGAPLIMMSHIAVEAWGGEPTSLNPEAYRYLRDEIGFRGVVVTDSLGMGALQGRPGNLGVEALRAGADLVLMPSDTAATHAAIVAALADGTLTRESLDWSAARSIALALWQARLPRAQAADGYAQRLALAGMTMSARDCSAPLALTAVTIRGGLPDERATLAALLAARGVAIGGGTDLLLLGTPDRAGGADIVVALDGPWGLAGSDAQVWIGLFGRGEPELEALADVLAGRASPAGEWPVAMGAVGALSCSSPPG